VGARGRLHFAIRPARAAEARHAPTLRSDPATPPDGPPIGSAPGDE